MMNGKHRARWLADMISEAQRYISKAKGAPETADVQKALNLLDDAKRTAIESENDAEDQDRD
jgi:hypothetical protein